MTIEIDGTAIGPRERPYIVAEIGINAHDDLTLAKRFIELAADADADAVKFQTHSANAEMVESEMRAIDSGNVYDTVANCEWSIDEHRELQSYAEANDVTFLSTPFSTDAVELLEEIDVPAIKIGSGEMNNRHLLGRAARTGKPLLVSTGMNTLEDIESTCEFLTDVASEFLLLYCVSAYPTTPEDFDFGTISTLEEITNVPIGFSDHSPGVEAAKAAIGNGSDLVEKHFTIDRRLPGPDQAVSVEPSELEDLCEFAALYHETSTKKDGLHREEAEIRQWAQHSVVAASTIEKGESLDKENTTTKRPGTGISARGYFEVLGETVTSTIEAGSVISEDDIIGR